MRPEISAVLLHAQAGPLPELKAALESQSVKTRLVTTCQEATCLLGSPDAPLLIFTDCQLPDGTWSDVVRLACQAPTPASVIVVSRLVDVSLYLDTLERGAFDFIVPPFEARELAHVLQCGVDNTLALRNARARSDGKPGQHSVEWRGFGHPRRPEGLAVESVRQADDNLSGLADTPRGCSPRSL